MPLPLLAALALAVLAAGYLLYGRLVARAFGLDAAATTPAVAVNDGRDFVPTRPFYLLGQHFSAIAAAGPIAGPILACQTWGWLPCLLWIAFGVVFIGAVHDFSALVASVRHKGQTIVEVVRAALGRRGALALMVFIWIALEYVIIAFTDITASTFVGKTEELAALGGAPFNKGGAVAAASALYLGLAVLMGALQRFLRIPLGLATALFVPATLGAVWLGTQVSTALVMGQVPWALLILGYCFVASLLPVWSLLQPRGYLGGFVLYLALAIGVVGLFFGGFTIEQPALREGPPLAGLAANSLFPFLFVTIACGACSGFHGLVCSGTTSKQIAKETHCRPVGYGGMLLEGFVAVIALGTILILKPPEVGKSLPGPGVVYGDGIGKFLTVLTGEGTLVFARTFGAMAFSTFVFDTLDVSTRLGRYLLTEVLGWRGKLGAILATAATAGVPALVLLAAGPPAPPKPPAYMTFWKLFGTSNQLLAALTLLGVTVWLRQGGKSVRFTLPPCVFVASITLWSLVGQAKDFFGKLVPPSLPSGAAPFPWDALANGVVAVVLIGLAGFLIVEAVRAWSRRPPVGGDGPALVDGTQGRPRPS
ncbi:MAG: carbon starvation protein A [Planctomycetales bacterium]|nr:carbon starvation protein A [Planctomycetales bacterium]